MSRILELADAYAELEGKLASLAKSNVAITTLTAALESKT